MSKLQGRYKYPKEDWSRWADYGPHIADDVELSSVYKVLTDRTDIFVWEINCPVEKVTVKRKDGLKIQYRVVT